MGVGKEQNIMYNIEESAKRLKELRRNKKVTQEQVANDLQISVDTVRKNEQGVRGLSIDIAELYAEYYETSIDFITQTSHIKNVIRTLKNQYFSL